MSIEVNQELLERYFEGECDAREVEAVLLFLQTDSSKELLDRVLEDNSLRDWAIFSQQISPNAKLKK
ncbi:hypothetical protein ACFOWA_01120 [Pedobacter lithocola]|uniref:Anti-sigma factor n=1 Tax=Pedobacter lithocola TaxID=1908239 RepID=A0ABV8P3D1_9SPHI